jgi:hypothetical protein
MLLQDAAHVGSVLTAAHCWTRHARSDGVAQLIAGRVLAPAAAERTCCCKTDAAHAHHVPASAQLGGARQRTAARDMRAVLVLRGWCTAAHCRMSHVCSFGVAQLIVVLGVCERCRQPCVLVLQAAMLALLQNAAHAHARRACICSSWWCTASSSAHVLLQLRL